MLGKNEPDRDRRQVYELLPLQNQWTETVNPFAEQDSSRSEPSSKRSRYWVDPKDLLAAQRYSRDRGWIILGVYHSHPDHPAVPSERDRQLAWAEYSYPIASVASGKVVTIQSWRLNQAGQFESELIQLAD